MSGALLLLPVALALFLWLLGSAVVVFHVWRGDSFIMAEIRRHGLAGDLLAVLLWFAVPYLAVGAACAWVARGLRRLAATSLPGRGAADGLLGSLLVVVFMVGSTLFAMVERPALMAGLFYLKGGWRRELQLSAGHLFSPPALAVAGKTLFVLLVLLAVLGWWRHATRRRRRLMLLVVVILVPLAAGSGWGLRSRVAVAPDGRPNVLLVIVDSLRPQLVDPDQPGALPALSRLAGESARFTDARTPLARTYPAVASLLTGLHPLRHGIRTIYPGAAARQLPASNLVARLGREGWRTIAVGGYCATVLRELESGFQWQRTPPGEASLIISSVALAAHPLLPVWLRTPLLRRIWPQMRNAVEGSAAMDVAQDAVAAWRRAPAPFFMTVFFDNTHLPYVPGWPEAQAAGTYDGDNRYSLAAGDLVARVRAGETAPDLARRHEEMNARRLYLAAAHGVDRALGKMLQALAADGLAEDTLVIVLADHGENLMDGGGVLAHGLSLERDRSNAVPLLMRWPGHIEPGSLSVPVSLTDMMPTILDLLGLDLPDGLDGFSQRPVLEREEGGVPGGGQRLFLQETGLWFFSDEVVTLLSAGENGLTYPAFDHGLLTVEEGQPPHVVIAPGHRQEMLRAKHRRLEAGPWALVYRPAEDGAHFSLYRQDEDPWRTQDLASREPGRLREMMDLFYAEARRLGDADLLPPAPGVIFSP